MMLEDRAGLGDSALYAADAGAARPTRTRRRQLAGEFSSFQINVPQLFADVDRDKVKQLGIPLNDVFQTLQIYLGSQYVNDFNKFGRTYQVIAQADAPFRSTADDIAQLKVRNAHGEMVPLGSVLNVKQSYGPDQVTHYNGYPAADINGSAGAGRELRARRCRRMERLAQRDAAERHRLRVDRAHVSAEAGRQHGRAASFRSACCSCSSCSPRSTRAGRCRS